MDFAREKCVMFLMKKDTNKITGCEKSNQLTEESEQERNKC